MRKVKIADFSQEQPIQREDVLGSQHERGFAFNANQIDKLLDGRLNSPIFRDLKNELVHHRDYHTRDQAGPISLSTSRSSTTDTGYISR